MTNLSLSYIAGVLESRGSLTQHRRGYQKHLSLCLRIHVNRPILGELEAHTGFKANHRKNKEINVFDYRLYDHRAAALLFELMPYFNDPKFSALAVKLATKYQTPRPRKNRKK